MRRLTAVLLWSAIAAAFVGPGTVTTCAAAGTRFGLGLLWALAFSTVATFVLQEAAARLTVASGLDLGRALRRRSGTGATFLVGAAIVTGCAAYQAGNLLGAVAGLRLVAPVPPAPGALAVAAAAGALLWLGPARRVARALALTVAAMGVVFLATAAGLRPPASELVAGLLLPSLPPGSLLLVLALVGTTVVPYNLFLGSGLAAGERLPEVRLGLAVAVGLGGAISVAIVVAGSAVAGEFGFEALGQVLAARLGRWARPALALGLFAAGLSSAVTAPLAAAITVRSLAGREGPEWADRGHRYRTVWGGVLAVGTAFAVVGVRPIPAIVAAQALNGVVLPLAAAVLLTAVNDRRLMGAHANGPRANVALVPVVAVTFLLGGAAVVRAVMAALSRTVPAPVAITLATVAGTAAVLAARHLARRRGAGP